MKTFSDLGLNPTTLRALERRGFTEPTPIQELAIPLLLQGEDLVGQAQTGTGKTAAFGLPIMEATRHARDAGVQTLILAPTRELANQLAEELNKLAHGTPFKALAVYGGVGFGNQTSALRRGDLTCIVACPGRLLDLLGRGDVDLRRVQQVVLDEADRMLDMGFVRDIEKIFGYLPKRRQTMLFSATLPPEILRLSERYLYKPERVRAETGPTTTELTDQFVIDIRGDKYAHLLALFGREKPKMSVIFTRTKHGAKRLAKRLESQGHRADALQGNLSQNARDRVMAAFREGAIDHLVATDVAARGLDVKGITHVVNFDMPTVHEDYVHRIGRTGRAGERGRAFLFVASDETREVRGIERVAGVPLQPYDVGPLPHVPAAQEPPRPSNGYGGNGRNGPRQQGGRSGQGGGGRSQGPRRGPGGPRSNSPNGNSRSGGQNARPRSR